MNQEFISHVTSQLKNFLPNRFQDAVIEIDLIKKSNGRNLTGMFIRKDVSKGIPTIYLDDFEKEYLKGKDINQILKEIAQQVLEAEKNDYSDIEEKVGNIIDYDFVKNLLAIRMVDPDKSKDFLKDKPYTKFGNLVITYRVQYDFGDGLIYSSVINNDLLKCWNISKSQLHRDALKSEKEKRPILLVENKISNLLTGTATDFSKNLYNKPGPLNTIARMYVLTNEQKTNGAAAIVQKGVLNHLGELFNKNFYLPVQRRPPLQTLCVKWRDEFEKPRKVRHNNVKVTERKQAW